MAIADGEPCGPIGPDEPAHAFLALDHRSNLLRSSSANVREPVVPRHKLGGLPHPMPRTIPFRGKQLVRSSPAPHYTTAVAIDQLPILVVRKRCPSSAGHAEDAVAARVRLNAGLRCRSEGSPRGPGIHARWPSPWTETENDATRAAGPARASGTGRQRSGHARSGGPDLHAAEAIPDSMQAARRQLWHHVRVVESRRPGRSIRLKRIALTTATVRLVVPSFRIAFLT
jgi:hypothetical protein